MDMSPFANSQQLQQPQTPNYLAQDSNNPTVAGGVSNMVKALMAGNQQFQQRQRSAPNPTTTTGGPSIGAPMSLTPPAPGPMAGGLSGSPAPMGGQYQPPLAPMSDQAFTMGAPPVGPDPVTQALFSPIPGALSG